MHDKHLGCYNGCRVAGVDRSPGERQGAKPASGLCGLFPVVPGPGVRDSCRPAYPGDPSLLQGGAAQPQPQLGDASGRLHHGVHGVPRGPCPLEPLAPPFKAEMSARYEGGEKIPLRVGGCTLQLRQARSHQYI